MDEDLNANAKRRYCCRYHRVEFDFVCPDCMKEKRKVPPVKSRSLPEEEYGTVGAEGPVVKAPESNEYRVIRRQTSQSRREIMEYLKTLKMIQESLQLNIIDIENSSKRENERIDSHFRKIEHKIEQKQQQFKKIVKRQTEMVINEIREDIEKVRVDQMKMEMFLKNDRSVLTDDDKDCLYNVNLAKALPKFTPNTRVAEALGYESFGKVHTSIEDERSLPPSVLGQRDSSVYSVNCKMYDEGDDSQEWEFGSACSISDNVSVCSDREYPSRWDEGVRQTTQYKPDDEIQYAPKSKFTANRKFKRASSRRHPTFHATQIKIPENSSLSPEDVQKEIPVIKCGNVLKKKPTRGNTYEEINIEASAESVSSWTMKQPISCVMSCGEGVFTMATTGGILEYSCTDSTMKTVGNNSPEGSPPSDMKQVMMSEKQYLLKFYKSTKILKREYLDKDKNVFQYSSSVKILDMSDVNSTCVVGRDLYYVTSSQKQDFIAKVNLEDHEARVEELIKSRTKMIKSFHCFENATRQVQIVIHSVCLLKEGIAMQSFDESEVFHWNVSKSQLYHDTSVLCDLRVITSDQHWIYAMDYGHGTVHMITHYGACLQQVVTNLQAPTHISIDNDEQHMMVVEDRKKVCLYKLTNSYADCGVMPQRSPSPQMGNFLQVP